MLPSPQDDTALPPDAALIQRRRTQRGLEGPLTVTRCAEMLATYTTKPFTDRTWANYEQGKRPIPDREFVLMGLVVGATPEDAEAVGRAEAGKLLRQEIERRRAPIVSGVPKETIERLERAVQEINALPFSEKQRNAMVEVLMRKVNLMLDLDRQQVDIMRDGTP